MRIGIIACHGGIGLPKLEEVGRMNISSAILYIAPERLYEACEALLLMPGVDIHARSPEGKVVVTLEDDDTNSAADKYVALHGVPGVASVAMVYQYSDDESVDTEEVEA
ncbi:chaperone NapD [Ferribacterium limneticum]|uniref:chaperone NapD n=1 Tax=Ferribacterium limneticum TaxID=76259 RepID=UPI001CFB1882|nr:chaperone NapD [Ferribacterium limneticum]UCV19547.1 chaperone NapD [Ferribacterium limneticum]